MVVPVPDLSFEGRRGIGVGVEQDELAATSAAATAEAWNDTRQRLALARSFHARLDAGEASSLAGPARLLGGISASGVGQFLRLLRLAPSNLERIEHDRGAQQALGDRALRGIAAIPGHGAQVEAFDTTMELLCCKGRKARGLQHHLERARHYRRLLEDEPGLTMGEIGAREGISAARVSQRLLLLAMANCTPSLLTPDLVLSETIPPISTGPSRSNGPAGRLSVHRAPRLAGFPHGLLGVDPVDLDGPIVVGRPAFVPPLPSPWSEHR